MNITGWRTIIFNAIGVIIATIRVSNPDFAVPDDAVIGQYVDAALLLIGAAGNIYLRYKTTTPVGEKPNA